MMWDRFIRVFHWSAASLFLANYWLFEEGDDWHEWAGYALLGLVLARLVWGFVGPTNARFASFVKGPQAFCHNLTHFAEAQQNHQGHTPMAGWMVLFLLVGILVTAISGWLQETDRFWGEDWVQWLHAIAAHLVMAAVVIHVSAVALIQWRFGVPLLSSMLWKRKRRS